MPKTTFKKQDTGMDYDEIFDYEETDNVNLCCDCRFQYNICMVAPCNDCNGYKDTGKNYFDKM